MTEKTEVKDQQNAKQDVVSMTIFIPTELHKRMKIDAIEKGVGLYDHVIVKLSEIFPERG